MMKAVMVIGALLIIALLVWGIVAGADDERR